jgi:hypothetical protein
VGGGRVTMWYRPSGLCKRSLVCTSMSLILMTRVQYQWSLPAILKGRRGTLVWRVQHEWSLHK